jgi:CDP-paratose 2-epimerase
MKVLIIGGAGFIGCNAAEFYLSGGHEVVVCDNLSRRGTPQNLAYLQGRHPELRFIRGDVRSREEMDALLAGHTYDAILLLASQVAVTTSVLNPREDFEINALGALNVLEAMRNSHSQAILLYASTNKVYGGMENLVIVERDNRYDYRDFPRGLSEAAPLDFHSPYGCSKGAADQYVRDYARIYGLKTVVFRQSCIYGYRQFGIEDQGWVAWFTIAAIAGMPITVYGDGKQVRDILFVTDLVRAYDMAIQNIQTTSGQVYNLGGGQHRLSLLELLAKLENMLGHKIPYAAADWRPGDQKVFVADSSKALREFGWAPKISADEGVRNLFNWVKDNLPLFEQVGLTGK